MLLPTVSNCCFLEFPYLSEVESVICLDSLAQDNSKMFVHVSKPPKEGTSNHEITKVSRLRIIRIATDC